MIFQNHFYVDAPLKAVAEFHQAAASMAAITPPPVIVRLHQAPDCLAEGDEMDFTLWLGPLPVRWKARIEGASATGFTDRQLEGPFEAWTHRHTFLRAAKGRTLVQDEIRVRLKRHPVWGPLGFLMFLNLPLLFAYRGWKTRRLLAKELR